MRSAIEIPQPELTISPTCLCRLLTPLLALILTATGVAQTSKISANLEGTVTDSSGAVIPNAEIRMRNVVNNHSRNVESDDQGFFRVTDLEVGTYAVQVEQPGFAPYRHSGIALSVGQTARLEVVLVPASQAAQITVTAQPPPLDTSQPAVTTTIDNERIEELPVRSRNYLNFVLLAPGVAASNSQQTSSAQPLSAESGFTFGGLRPRSNGISIDGVDNNDEYTGTSRTELSLETVREFQVVNNGLSAESGGASGGSINVVTKSGSNIHHGDAFIFAQNVALNARDPVTTETAKPDLSRYRIGGSLGGPLVKDRTFYYTAFEQEHTRAQGETDIDPAITSAINRFFASGAYARLGTRQITAELFPVSRAETEASGKLNHQISDQHSLMLRYAFTNNREASDAFNTGGLTDASARGSSFTKDHALVGSLVSTLRSTTVNDLRFQLASRTLALRTNDQIGPEIDIDGLISFGRPYDGNSRRTENHYQLSDTLGLARSRHLIKAGLTVNHVHLSAFEPSGFGAVYLFPDLASFFAGRPDSFRQAFGNANTKFAVTSYASFLQDHWSPTRRVTVDLGVRYDFEWLPAGLNQDTNNVSPRLGIAYSPSTSWVLRAGYGIFYDRYSLAYLNRAIEKDGSCAFEQVADGDTAANIFTQAAGGRLEAPVPDIRPSIFRADPRLATSYSQQASSGIERLLTTNLTVSANYLLVRGMKLARTRNSNLFPPAVLTPPNAASLGASGFTLQQIGRLVFGPGRLNSRFNDVYYLEDSARSTYHGISLALNRRLANELEFSATYTFSKTLDDASDFDEQPENPFDLKSERAVSRNHQSQRFVLSALFDLPFGEEEGSGAKGPTLHNTGSGLLGKLLGHIEVAPIVTLGSGRPVNPLTGVDSNHSHSFPLSTRPLGFARNSLHTPGFATVDLRALKYFKMGEHGKLDFVVEAFNLFNRVNVGGINPFFGTSQNPLPGFAHPTDAFNARQIQFSLDFEF